MIDFFRLFRPKSHYEQEAEGPKIHVHRFLSTNEKIVEACKDLDAYAREYVPAPELTEAQKAEIQKGQIERELHRDAYDKGILRYLPRPNNLRIRE